VPTVVGIPAYLRISIHHYSVIDVVFDNANDVVHPVPKFYEIQELMWVLL
jgi:hypothetical protein